MNSRPVVFIGSSSEGLPVARALNASMTYFANSTLWIHTFPPTYGYLESLTKTLEAADFAVLILTPDDVTESRGAEWSSPRDNVVFELGLFMGHLGQHRCIFVYDRLSPIKLPSDLFGVAGATFDTRPDGNMTAALEPICYEVETMVSKVGLRAQILKFTHRELQTNSSLPDLSGEWAGYSPDGPVPDEQNSKVTIQQFGSFVRGTIMIYKRGSERELDFEGKFTTGGQLVMFFQDRKGRGYIVGTIILHLTSDLSLRGQSIYYDHTKDMVISKARLLQRL